MILVKSKGKEYVNSNGETKQYVNFYIVLDNGVSVAVRPCFAKDTAVMKAVAEER